MPIFNKKIIFYILGVLFFANILAWLVVFDLAKAQFLEVHFFDVGQGDAIFIEMPKRYQILIDGGPSSIILEKLSKEMSFWDRTIDLIILTHPEADHLSGLNEVLKRYKVENILWTGIVRDTAEYKEWLKLINEGKAKIFLAKAGQKISTRNVFLELLFPFENLEGKEFKDSNNTSIVGKLVFGDISFLFTGDIYKEIEKELIDRSFNLPVDVDSDIFKISHHGSKTSTSEEFLKEVSPEIAVISVGKNNSYNHPHQEVLEVLSKYGINVLRTDEQGDITIISDGKNYALSNF
jgi:competence protein ComEC